jgi:hypothetical protein
VAPAEGTHPDTFRTRKLSPPAPMVLPGQPGGRVGRRGNPPGRGRPHGRPRAMSRVPRAALSQRTGVATGSAHQGGDGCEDLTPGPCRVRRHRAVSRFGITGSLPEVEVDHGGVGATRVALTRRGQGRRDHRHPRRGCGRSRDRCRASPGRCQGRQPLATAHRPRSVGPPAPPARPEGLSSSRGARSARGRGPPGWPRGARRWSAGCRRRDGRRTGRRARCARGRPRRCG